MRSCIIRRSCDGPDGGEKISVDVLSVDQLWPGLSIAAEAVVVEISLEFGNAVDRGVERSQAGSVVAVPKVEIPVGSEPLEPDERRMDCASQSRLKASL